ncbi:hypothetical protein [Hymenobacter sp. DG25A]|uniref:hypothetical protein n=1 Tax=Hymenobacter sp. DG25A TaxID=1385663 RepID=UPI0006BC9A39|nr:hypothetical protein [Hymenobacter sp. DG25A]ALD20632.1 hypothetical protein AM218_04580 [Hymenobacter sp. DG25A]
MERLLNFAGRVLRLVPVLLWWAVVVGIGCFLNLLLLKEVWPNTPRAEPVLVVLLAICAFLVPWLVAQTANRIAKILSLQGSLWCWLWRLITIVSLCGATLSTIIVGVLLLLALLRGGQF